ncbi:MAG: putative quinol monooxygenase [Clostridia bacterium]|nr:putative quinol monooxygenase [Clostridia bacterium]
MLILHVTYTAKPGMTRKFLDELEQGPAPKVRAEKGNLRYDYFISPADENKILLVEKWEDEMALAAHMAVPHMQDIKSIKEKYIESTLLEKFSAQPL